MKRILEKLENAVLLILISVVTVLIWLQISSRVTGYSLQWSEEITRYLFVWIVFMGSAAGIRTKSHIGAEFISAMLGEKGRLILALFQNFVFFVFLSLTIYYSIPFIMMQYEFGQMADTLNIPMYLITSIIPVAFSLGLISLLARSLEIIRELKTVFATQRSGHKP